MEQSTAEGPCQVSEPWPLLLGHGAGGGMQCLRNHQGEKGTLPQPQADTEAKLRQSLGDSQTLASSGSYITSGVPTWSRPDLPSKVQPPPLQTTTTTTMKSPHSLTSLYTRGKKEEARFLTSHGAFSRDTSSSTGGFGCHRPGGEQKLPGLWVGLSWAPPALQNQDQDPA